MQAPKRKTSVSKRNMRRSHDFITPVHAVSCKNCGEPVVLHRVCRACGFYRGKQVVKTGAEA